MFLASFLQFLLVPFQCLKILLSSFVSHLFLFFNIHTLLVFLPSAVSNLTSTLIIFTLERIYLFSTYRNLKTRCDNNWYFPKTMSLQLLLNYWLLFAYISMPFSFILFNVCALSSRFTLKLKSKFYGYRLLQVNYHIFFYFVQFFSLLSTSLLITF